MQKTRTDIMNMPIVVEIIGQAETAENINSVFDYFIHIDETFSPFKTTSEVSRYNRGEISDDNISKDFQLILKLAEKTRKESNGYFDIKKNDKIYPSGIVKGWAIQEAGKILQSKKAKNYYINCGGDIEVTGLNKDKKPWLVGIQNPFNPMESVKTLYLTDCGIATSGNYIRGQHVYNPKNNQSVSEIVSITIIGPNVLEADRFATAAFAMGTEGINFIENRPSLEGYMIDKNGVATMTSGFEKYSHTKNELNK